VPGSNPVSRSLQSAGLQLLEYDQSSAELHCRKILSIDPNHFDSVFLLATLSAIQRNFNEAKKLFISGIQFASAIFLLDVTGNSSDPGGRGFSDGDPDKTFLPVAGSLKLMPWHKDSLAQVLVTIQDTNLDECIVDPRNALAKVWEKFEDLNLSLRS